MKNIMEKKVSVIMATYNEELDWIKKSINSILNQTYKNLEFIIVNDNPENRNIIVLLEAYQNEDNRIKLIKNSKNLGLVRSLNRALSECSGEYIIRMDADDISEYCRIEKQINFLENNNCDIVMSNAVIIDEHDNSKEVYLKTPSDTEGIKRLLKYKNVGIHPTWAFKKDILNKLNGYREYNYIEDYEFLCRAIIHGFKLACIQENLLKYRMRSTSICNSNRLEQQVNFQIINKRYVQALKNGITTFESKAICLNTKERTYLEKYKSRIELSNYLISNNKVLQGKYIIIYAQICNKYKRRQLINEFKYKINCYFLDK